MKYGPHDSLCYYTRQTTRAATTNDPIALVKINIARNADARRCRDLMLHYQVRIGEIRMRDESVRVRVLSLVNATLELERLTTAWLLAVARSFWRNVITTAKVIHEPLFTNAATPTC